MMMGSDTFNNHHIITFIHIVMKKYELWEEKKQYEIVPLIK